MSSETRGLGVMGWLLLLLGVRGLAVLWEAPGGRIAATAVALLLCFAGLRDYGFATEFYRDCVGDIRDQQEAVGAWLASSTPADARIAINDAGAIAFRSRRPVLDLVGLGVVAEVAFDVRGKGAGRFVASGAVFF